METAEEVVAQGGAEVASEVVDAAAGGALDIAKLDLTTLALAQFGDWNGAVAAARKTLTDVEHDLSNQSRIDEAKSLRWRLIGQPRADARAMSKALKSRLAKTSKAIGEAEDAIVKAWDETEQLITPAIDAAQQKLDDEKQAKEEAERTRVAAIRARINDIFAQPAACAGLPSGEIELSIVGVEVLMTDKAFYEELQAEAEAAAEVVLTKLRSMRDVARAAEEQAERQRLEAERLAAERAELERQRAEFEARQRAEREAQEAREAAARAEQERLERERAEAERQAREAREAEERAIREQREAEERRIAEARAAEEAELQRRRDKLDAEHRLIEQERALVAKRAEEQRLEAERLESERLAALQRARQEDAFQEERAQAEAAAGAAPRQTVRPTDEALTAAVAKAFKVDALVAAEWLGSYDALAEIDRIKSES